MTSSINKIAREQVRAVFITVFTAAALIVSGSGCGRSEPSADATPKIQDEESKREALTTATPVAGIPEDAPTLAEVYPALASGALSLARLTELPPGVLLHADGIRLTEQDLENAIAEVPPAMSEQMRRNAFFVLEQKATMELLMAMARSRMKDADIDDSRLLQRYLEEMTRAVAVPDSEIDAFYAENRDMMGGAPLDQVRPSIRQHLLQEKQQGLIEEHIRGLGESIPIALAKEWVANQAVSASDNVVERARASGRPSFVSFGADACMPCRMMAPFRDKIRDQYDGKVNVVYVNVQEDQFLSARYGVRGIPHIIFFDSDGEEFHVHSGFMPLEQIEEHLRKMGI